MNDKVRVIYDSDHSPGFPYRIQVKKWWGWYTRGIWHDEKEAVIIAKKYVEDMKDKNRIIFIGG